MPCSSKASGFTAYTRPVKPPSMRCSRRAYPTVPHSRLAPITATDDGVRSSAMLRASARCSRASITARDFRVGSMSKLSITTPSSKCRSTS